ncbi:MAG: hypothetical protein GXO19_05130 [Epsilonproteobacteria bacterium]|nr:hypothetical protein [Campylobacterota bacterium]NPA57101.1 hypothetical protein [Campylobacterota bacterium]
MTIITATRAEAKPLIALLRLHPLSSSPFPLYSNGEIELIVSGIGPLNGAVATAFRGRSPLLNVGLCGGEEVGELYNIYKVIDDPSSKSYLLSRSPTLPNGKVRTLSHPATRRYRELVDMEASGIVVASRRLGLALTVVKIVSDRYDPTEVTPQRAEELIGSKVNTLLDIIGDLNSSEKVKGRE